MRFLFYNEAGHISKISLVENSPLENRPKEQIHHSKNITQKSHFSPSHRTPNTSEIIVQEID